MCCFIRGAEGAPILPVPCPRKESKTIGFGGILSSLSFAGERKGAAGGIFGHKECGAEMYPPVTASPCQPPLGKGAERTGDADCHDQFANWSRNDTFSRSAVQARAGGEIGEAPPVADAARRFRGSAPIGGHDSGRQSVGTTVGKRTPPLRSVTRGMVGWVTARVAPGNDRFLRWFL